MRGSFTIRRRGIVGSSSGASYRRHAAATYSEAEEHGAHNLIRIVNTQSLMWKRLIFVPDKNSEYYILSVTGCDIE